MSLNQSTTATQLLGDDGPFAVRWPNFEARSGQLELAEAVEASIATGRHLVAEAATGIGKTFAYLVPAVSAGRKTIVSTGTRNLQDQLFRRDLPRVLETLQVDDNYRVALLKGRSNYLCHYRLDRARGGPTLRREHGALLDKLVRWAAVADSGDLADFPDLNEASSLRSQITSTTDNCLGADCPFFDECFVAKARAKAQKADLVVVNHHLLFADMSLRREGFGELLPLSEVVIVDEAHKLPETASLFFGQQLSSRQFDDLVREVKREAGLISGGFDAVQPMLETVQQGLREFRLAIDAAGARRQPRGDWLPLRDDVDVIRGGERLQQGLVELVAELAELAAASPGIELCWRRAGERLGLLRTLLGEPLQGHVAWYEANQQTLQLNLTPLSVAEELDAFRLQTAASWVFTSATLAVGQKFELFQQAVGLDDADICQIASPFNYPQQSLMYLPRTLPDPRQSDFVPRLLDQCLPLIDQLGGHTLMLFTSYRNLRAAATLLAEATDLPLLVQGERPRHALLRAFEDEPASILLGAASFWEGVDIPGSALRCVIIDKLPFPPPDDPVTRGRSEALREAGGNPFVELHLPQAILALKQGAGRLIRDRTDRGLLVLGDPRLTGKAYGKRFLNNLPPMPATSEADEVVAFLDQISMT